MPLVQWSDKYSVKVGSIDDQHKIWLNIINKLNDAMKKREASKVLASIFDELYDYTKTHFGYEEKLFAQYNYPNTKDHVTQHHKFIKELDELKEKFDKGALLLSMQVINHLQEWLVNHIMKIDKEYSDFFVEKNVK